MDRKQQCFCGIRQIGHEYPRRRSNDLAALLAQIKKEESSLESWYEDLELGFTLASFLAETSSKADLDGILERVLVSASQTESVGSIRTPSVVLSKNNKSTDAIGGHNIGLTPGRMKVAEKAKGPFRVYPKGDKNPTFMVRPQDLRRATEIMKGTAEVLPRPEPPLKPIEELKSNRSGGLLDEMRPAVQDSAGRISEVVDRASQDECEALVSQASDGSIVFARRGPPTKAMLVFGKSGILDALEARLPCSPFDSEGIDRRIVKSILDTTELMNQSNRRSPGRLDKILQNLPTLFHRQTTDDQIESVAFHEPGRPVEILRSELMPEPHAASERLGNGVQHRLKPSWKKPGMRNSAPLRRVMPDFTALSFASHQLVLPNSSRLGILALAPGAPAEAFKQKLIATVRSWLAISPERGADLKEGIVKLRAAILKRLPETKQLEFFFNRNAKRFALSRIRPLISVGRRKASQYMRADLRNCAILFASQ